MQLIVIIKRIASNLIDLFLFLIGFGLLEYYTSINNNIEASFYLLLVTFLLLFFPSLLFLGNTFGKLIMRVNYNNPNKHIILTKYSIYFLIFFPGFSIVSLITNFPYFKLSNYDFAVSIQLLISLTITDIVVFVFSLGKYHILDYILNIKIQGLEYIKNPLKSLSIILFSWSVLIFINLFFLKKDISVKSLYSNISNDIYTENFPEDLFYGNKVFVVKRKSDAVFIPSDMLSFLFKKEYDQKLLFLSLPFEIFNSKQDRFIICKELLSQSLINDIFMQFRPKQTRITLRTFEKGNFLEYYNYTYTYYFNRDDNWGLYGGIKNDSTMIDSYNLFLKQAKGIKSEKIRFQSTILSNKIIIKSNNAKLQFDKISFDKTPLRGMMQLNFPPQNIIYRTNYWNIIDGSEIPDLEEDFFYLQFCRGEISSKSL